ncbi:MAG: hypothetical protein IPJ66_05120 [Bacteroidetes bacterium]|nr:hypothetical protein [Bacteroidota bacterium]MBL0066317.1 hypothetical protein [Bacteroidota bacterium]MBL0139031.1 hypothetical protein [Bacteroidota bacterium]
MKRSAIIFSLLVFSVFSSVLAQRGQNRSDLTPAERAEKATLRMKSQLHLSEEQTQQVRELFLKRGATEEKNRENMKKQREETDQALSKILSKEQMDHYNQMKDDRRKKMMDHRRAMQQQNTPQTEPADTTAH